MQPASLTTALTAIGLSEKQSKVYIASRMLGPAPAQKIAEQAGLNRPTTYDMLDELSRLGLVTRGSDSSKSIFTAVGIDGLKDFLKTQAQEVARRDAELDRLIPALEHIGLKPSETAITTRLVHGAQAVAALQADALSKTAPGKPVLLVTRSAQALNLESHHPALLVAATQSKHLPIADITIFHTSAILAVPSDNPARQAAVIIENTAIAAALRQLFTQAQAAQPKSR